MFTKLRFVVSFCVLFLMAFTAHAQIGLYVNPIATHITNSTADTGPFAFLGEGSTSRTFWGASFGGYDDFFHGKSVNLGIDIRDEFQGANNAHINSFMLGMRVSPKPIQKAFRPYLQLSGGAGTTKAPHSSVHVTRGQWAVMGGLDYSLNRIIDVRMFEVGYGTLTTISTQTVGGGATIPAASLLSVSAGLVFRIR